MPANPLSSFRHRLSGDFERYARITIEGALTVAATIVGLVLLPPSVTVAPPGGALSLVRLVHPDDPAYLGVVATSSSSTVTLLVGMQVPAGGSGAWQLQVTVAPRDTVSLFASPGAFAIGGTPDGMHMSRRHGSTYTVSGQLPPGSDSFTELQHGFVAYSTAHQFGTTKFDVVSLRVSGPVAVTARSGATLATALPGIQSEVDTAVGSPSSSGATGTGFALEVPNPASFVGEADYGAGRTYENLTGAPQIEDGSQWDWMTSSGAQTLPPLTATGVNPHEQAEEQNQLFVAAVLFGLAASFGSGFLLDILVAAVRRRKTAAGKHPAG